MESLPTQSTETGKGAGKGRSMSPSHVRGKIPRGRRLSPKRPKEPEGSKVLHGLNADHETVGRKTTEEQMGMIEMNNAKGGTKATSKSQCIPSSKSIHSLRRFLISLRNEC